MMLCSDGMWRMQRPWNAVLVALDASGHPSEHTLMLTGLLCLKLHLQFDFAPLVSVAYQNLSVGG